MKEHYLIDGNNLLGKIKDLWELQQKNGQASREKIAMQIDRFFIGKKKKATIFFDGFPGEAIKLSHSKINYSLNKTADDEIKFEIELAKNPKHLVVVSSDNSIVNFARVCSCKSIKSEDFARSLRTDKNDNSEIVKSSEISVDEIKKLFGVG